MSNAKTTEVGKPDLFAASYTIGINQRYHRYKTAHYQWWGRLFRFVVMLLTMTSVVLSACAFYDSRLPITIAGIAVSGVSAFIAAVLVVVPFSSLEEEHRRFLVRWNDLREEVESALFLNKAEQKLLFCRVQSKLHRLCGEEPAPTLSLLKQCEAEEMASRHKAGANSTATI